MGNLIYFVLAVIITIASLVIDGISHQKFKPRNSKIFHIFMIPIFLASMIILAIKVINFSILIYPGAILIVIGLFLAFTGLREIKENLIRAKKVYSRGIYSKIRHPVYVGLIISMIGSSLIVNSLLFFIYSLLVIIMFIWLAFYEEKHLARRFPAYKKYKKETGMFFPRI